MVGAAGNPRLSLKQCHARRPEMTFAMPPLLLRACLLLFVIATVGATEKIEGAFGLKLGAIYAPPEGVRPYTSELRKGDWSYPLRPDPRPIDLPGGFFVHVIPPLMRIFALQAQLLGDRPAADAIVAVLTRKYGAPVETHQVGSSLWTWEQSSKRAVIVTFKGRERSVEVLYLAGDASPEPDVPSPAPRINAGDL